MLKSPSAAPVSMPAATSGGNLMRLTAASTAASPPPKSATLLRCDLLAGNMVLLFIFVASVFLVPRVAAFPDYHEAVPEARYDAEEEEYHGEPRRGPSVEDLVVDEPAHAKADERR